MIKIIELSTMKERMLAPNEASVLCLGNFDGVHIAHAELIRRTVTLAKEISMGDPFKERVLSGAFFFLDHPSESLNSVGDVLLTDIKDKLEIFRSLGLEIAAVARFDQLMNLSPEEFVSEILKKECAAVGAVCGYNFRFGRGGSGNAARLCSLFGENNCEVVERIDIDGYELSSSAIRTALENGDVKLAAMLLGRNFFVRASVELDFDGAAIARFDKNAAVPREGAYRARLIRGEESFDSSVRVVLENGNVFCRGICDKISVGENIKIEFIEKI